MITVEEAVRAIMLARSEIVAIVGSRIAPLSQGRQTGSAPGIKYQRNHREKDHTNSGASGFSTVELELTLESYAYDTTRQLLILTEDTLDGFRGTVGGVSGLIIHSIFWDSDDDVDPIQDTDSNRIIYQATVMLTIMAGEDTPSLPVLASSIY